jgi:hypothetical protein
MVLSEADDNRVAWYWIYAHNGEIRHARLTMPELGPA